MLVNGSSQSVSEQLPNFVADELEELGTLPREAKSSSTYWKTFRRKAWLIIGITSLTTFAAGIWSALEDQTYTGNFYLLVEPITSAAKLTDPTTLTRTGGIPDEQLFELDYPTNLAFLNSPGMTLRIAQDVQRQELTRAVPAIWKDLRDNFKVERVGGNAVKEATKIFEVSYTGKNAQEVQSVLNIAANTFLKYSEEDRQTSIKAGVKFIDDQLPSLQKQLDRLQSQQKQLRQRYELLDPIAKGQDLSSQLSDISKQQLSTASQLKAQKTLYTQLQRQLKLTPEQALAASSLSQDPTRVALLSDLQKIESQLALDSARFTANSPQIQELVEKRQNTLKLLNQKTQEILAHNSVAIAGNSAALTFQDPTRLKLIEQLIDAANQVQVLEVQNQSLMAAKQSFQAQAQRLPAIVQQYNDIDERIKLTQEILDKLLVQRETLKVEAAKDLPWQLISKPQIPLDADGQPMSESPGRIKKVLAGLAGGLLLSMALAMLIEKRRDLFYTPEDLQALTANSVVGEIPYDDPLAPHSSLGDSPDDLELAENAKGSEERGLLFMSAFDALYTNLTLIYSNPLLRSLAISSTEVGDGQSTVAVYLARTAAAAGKKVLLVDANLSNPQLHRWFNLPNEKGLSTLLQQEVPNYDAIERSPERDELFVLSAGSAPVSPQVLSSPKMRHLMKELKARYDLIIYDAPHVLDSAASRFLAANTDGLLMVVGIGKTRQSLVKKAIEQMQRLRVPVLGMVANSPNPFAGSNLWL
jgi:capsular exopolysaccharide synthesis family protein